MSVRSRIFAIDDNGRVHKMPATLFDDIPRKKQRAIPEFADKRIKMALISVEMKDRTPLMVIRESYMVVRFDKTALSMKRKETTPHF